MGIRSRLAWDDVRVFWGAAVLYVVLGAGSLLVGAGGAAVVTRVGASLLLLFMFARLIARAAPIAASAALNTPLGWRLPPLLGIVLLLGVLGVLRLRPEMAEGVRLLLGVIGVVLFAAVLVGLNIVADRARHAVSR